MHVSFLTLHRKTIDGHTILGHSEREPGIEATKSHIHVHVASNPGLLPPTKIIGGLGSRAIIFVGGRRPGYVHVQCIRLSFTCTVHIACISLYVTGSEKTTLIARVVLL